MLVLVILSMFAVVPSIAQSSAPHRTLPAKRYCHPTAGFCFRYPNLWTMQGEVFDGDGVVVAPEQKGDRAQWDEITVALVAVPSDSSLIPSLNGVIEQAAAGMRDAGQDFQTLQRRELTVGTSPAQMLKAQYRENSTGHDWIEELVFIQGPENEIYSVALKCAPEHLTRLEPAIKEVLASWTVTEPQTAPSDPKADKKDAVPGPASRAQPKEKP